MKQILMPNGKINKKLIAIIALIAFTTSSLLWYFAYYTKTPAYSLTIIREAVKQHDLAKFNKHVDLDTSLSYGYDDLTKAAMDSNEQLTPEQKAFAYGFIQMLKTPIVGSVKEAILHYVQNGSWDKTQTTQEKTTQNFDTQAIVGNTNLKTTTLKGIEYTKQDGQTAILGIKITEKETNKDFILDLKMRQLDDSTWQITQISNLHQYLTQVEKYKKEAAAKK